MSAPGWFERASVMGGGPDDPFWRAEDQTLMSGASEWLGGEEEFGDDGEDEDDWRKRR